MGRDDRKTDDLLDEDKTCPVEIIQMPYQRANNSYTWLIPSNTTTATYFVRVYIDKANKHEIAYGQSTNENKTTNLFQIDGVVAPPEPQPQPGSAWSLVGSSLGYRYAWFLVLLLMYGVVTVVGVLFLKDMIAFDGVLFLNDMITYRMRI
ncbi:high-affinity nitrate transporter 3.1-like protein [Tanacetum coccineum]